MFKRIFSKSFEKDFDTFIGEHRTINKLDEHQESNLLLTFMLNLSLIIGTKVHNSDGIYCLKNLLEKMVNECVKKERKEKEKGKKEKKSR